MNEKYQIPPWWWQLSVVIGIIGMVCVVYFPPLPISKTFRYITQLLLFVTLFGHIVSALYAYSTARKYGLKKWAWKWAIQAFFFGWMTLRCLHEILRK